MARVTVALAVVASLAAAAPAARAAENCEVPEQAQVRARTETAVVYRAGNRVEACLERVGEPVFLMFVGPEEAGEYHSRAWLGAIALAGPYVAYVERRTYNTDSPSIADYARVRRVDLRERNRQMGVGSAESYDMTPTVPRLLMAPDGAIAYSVHWIEMASPYGDERNHNEVRVRDVIGLRYLDDAPDLDVLSLRRRGRTVTWKRGDRRLRARLRTTGSCRIPTGAHIEAYSRRLLVYVVRRNRAGARVADVVACFRRDGERFTLATEARSLDRFEAGDNFRIAGRYVAWSEGRRDRDGAQRMSFRVYDVDARRFLRTETLEEHGADTGEDFKIWDLALSRSGDVAWTIVFGQTVKVEAWDACGRRELSDEPGIDTESLRVVDRTAIWTAGGVDRSARFRSSADC